MTDRTHPDSGRATGAAHIIRYALELGLLWVAGGGRGKVREALDALDTLEAQLEAIGAGGVSGPLMGRAAPPTAQAEGWRPPELEWDEVFDCAVAAYCRSSTSHDALRLCFQSRNQQHQISCGWTANELMDFARGIARLYSPPTSAEGVEHG